MGQLSTDNLENWQQKRILSFFNRAQSAREITDLVLDDPQRGGTGHGIGETVAQRILDHRNQLRPRFFREFNQLNGIQGLGQDKLNDLAYTFRHTAAEVFHQQLFAGVLQDNWKIETYDRLIEDPDTYRDIVRHPEKLRSTLGEMLRSLARQRFPGEALNELAPYLLTDTYLDLYESQDLGQYAWATWFYRFDADNWFSFDRIRAVIATYLSTYWNEDISLVLVKGFSGGKLWPGGVPDMPVTLNPAEQRITLWRVELWD